MMDRDRIKKFNSLKENYAKSIAEKNYIIKNINELNESIEMNKELELQLQTTMTLLNEVSNRSRELAKQKLETIVTNALQYAFEIDIKFLVELSVKRGVPSVEFKIVKKVNGVESVQNPMNSNGGGVVDIISTALRYAYLMAIDENLAKIIILDEPGKMISKDVSNRYSEFIKELSSSFGIQTIFITHETKLEDIAFNLIEVVNIEGTSVTS